MRGITEFIRSRFSVIGASAFGLTIFFLAGCATESRVGSPGPGASFEELDRRARAGLPVSIVFYGGALAWGANTTDPLHASYRAHFENYLRDRYPGTPLTFYNAAIGGGSKLGMFRLQKDVLSHHPDLVVLDFTIDDNPEGVDRETLTSYERILIELIRHDIPVLQVFFAHKRDFGAAWKTLLPVRLRDHVELARLYRTGVADAATGLQAFLADGKHELNEIWNGDNVYPNDLGHQVIFESVQSGFEEAVRQKRRCLVPFQSVFADHYSTQVQIYLAGLPLPAGWAMTKCFSSPPEGVSNPWLDELAVCDASHPGKVEPLQIAFNGTSVGVVGEADEDGISFRVTIDGKPLPYRETKSARGQSAWPTTTEPYGGGKLFFWRELTDKLRPGPHVMEIQPEFSGSNSNGQLRLESICIAGEPESGVRIHDF